jgi:hypothetical protein
VRQQVTISLRTEFENFSMFKPGEYTEHDLTVLPDQAAAWSSALAPLRTIASAA